jgi:hypothetical protein
VYASTNNISASRGKQHCVVFRYAASFAVQTMRPGWCVGLQHGPPACPVKAAYMLHSDAQTYICACLWTLLSLSTLVCWQRHHDIQVQLRAPDV